jgi:hypothetical protein
MVLNVATTVPTAPTTLTATLGTPSRADLTWADNATNEVGYFVQRRTGADAFATIAELVPDVRTYSDLTVTANQQYDYQVIAYNQAGNSAPSNLAAVNGPTLVQVSGTITNVVGGTPVSGVTVTFSNGGGTTTTNTSGAYSVTLPYGWTGTITPSLVGKVFIPLSRSLTNVIVATFGQDFQAATAVAISGRVVLNPALTALPGVTVTFSNGAGTATTDANGNYTQNVPSGWSGTATFSLAGGYTFAAASYTFTNVTTPKVGYNSRATHICVISGNVNNNGVAFPGATITLNNGGGTTTTDVNGNFARTVNAGWSGTVTATRTQYTFTPVNYTITNIQSDTPAQNFAVAGVAISGQVYQFGSAPRVGIAGVTITLSGVGTTTTNASGNFSIFVPLGWTGTLTYSGLSKVYSPTTRNFTNVLAPTTGWNATTP